jgi:rifampicin phosphotransferase
VNGHMYTRMRPLISPDKPAKKLPPLWVLRVATRVHPEMRRRARAASKTLSTAPWNRVIHDWHNGGKSSIEQRNFALQSVRLADLDFAALMEHVRECWDNCLRGWEHHFWLHGYDLGPLGRFLLYCEKWGLEALELLPLLEGASPSTSGPSQQAAEICRAVKAAGREPATLTELRAISPAIAAMVDSYLERKQWVLFSRYDIDGVALGERPELVFAMVMAAEHRDASQEIDALTATIRERVPVADRAEFDELLGTARDAMDLRDDNGPVTAEWPLGLLRRALLAVGDAMVAAGVIKDRYLALELHPEDLQVITIAQLPTAAELLRRREARAEQALLDAPWLIGPAELAPPLEVLPTTLADVVAMVQTVVRHLGMDGDTNSNGLQGSGVGTSAYRGTARVASSPEEALDRLEPGDVLVVACTTPAYNLVLSLAGAVVTAAGGPMSHAAVIARELGIPAVIGARTALVDIRDGAQVEVDPVGGLVRILS